MAGVGRSDSPVAPQVTKAGAVPLSALRRDHNAIPTLQRHLSRTEDLGIAPKLGTVTDQQAWMSVVDTRSTETGSSISSSSSSKDGSNSFPERLASLDLAATGFRASDFSFNMVSGNEDLSGWSLKTNTLGFAANRFLIPQLQASEKATIQGRISRPHHITLSEEELCNLGIARDASRFVFSYPIVTARPSRGASPGLTTSPFRKKVFGGYMYFDSDMVL
eukprot:CAMPEP_0115559814 /NCGR_PEP_ID=MMETSP0271-20121206/100144_1 /TAXON_ID=71861 /ORGANISM="Scrippsiella trochoidea, Strain CCMP3099" /LENGTH=219 /DNA_ID=CAMNT_0002993865 /DNA_START=47 /DNA_END=703 /DNA_ORIENTATION=+